jgi:hypothetical protein
MLLTAEAGADALARGASTAAIAHQRPLSEVHAIISSKLLGLGATCLSLGATWSEGQTPTR